MEKYPPLKKESTDTYCNMDGFQRLYEWWKKLNRKEYILHDFFTWNLRIDNTKVIKGDQSQNSGYLNVIGEILTEKLINAPFIVLEIFSILIYGEVTQVYTNAQFHCTAFLNLIYFILQL